MLNSIFKAQTATVKSFLVQADYAATPKQKTRSQVLVRHLLSRFQADDTGDDEQTTRRSVFACGAAAVAPVFAAVMLYPAYHPLTIVPTHRPYWSQAGDEYAYVLYSFVAMAIACVVQWESIFPDLLDVFALAVLPLPARTLLRTRVQALVILFGVLLLCIALPGAVLLPLVAEGPGVFRHIAAHLLATVASGACACAALLATQSALEIACGVRLSKQLTPLLQTGLLLALFALLGYTPVLLTTLQEGALHSSRVANSLPPLWFLGIYEQIRGGAPDPSVWAAFARRGWLLMAISLPCAALAYPVAYSRRTRYLIESGNAAVRGVRSPAWAARLLHRTIVPGSRERATFHLVAQTVFRISHLRTTLTIYVGIGAALVLGSSMHLPSRAVAIIACAVALGGSALVRKQFMQRASWIYQILPEAQEGNPIDGGTAAVTLWAMTASLAVLIVVRFGGGSVLWRGVILAATAALALPSLLSRLFLAGTRDFPFTENPDATPEHFVLLFLRNLVLVPAGVLAFGWIAARASVSNGRVLLWCSSTVVLAVALHRLRRNRKVSRSGLPAW